MGKGDGESHNAGMFERWQRQLLDECRVARLATIMEDGRPRLLPVCYAVLNDHIVIPVDEKPKRSIELARLRDIRRNRHVTFLADRYEEDWTRLAWVRVEGEAHVLDHAVAAPDGLALLRARYPQYAGMALEPLPLVDITPTRVTGWRWADEATRR